MKRKSSETKKPKKASEIEHYNAVLIEHLKGEFKAVAEAVEGNREVLEEKIEDSEKRIREDLRGEMLATKHRLEAEILASKQDVHAYLVEIKQDLMREILTRFREVDTRLDQHDHEIQALKTA